MTIILKMYKTIKKKCTFNSFSFYINEIMWYILFGKVFLF